MAEVGSPALIRLKSVTYHPAVDAGIPNTGVS